MQNDNRMALVKTMMEEYATSGSAELILAQLAEDVTWKTTAPAGTRLRELFIGSKRVEEYFRRSDELLEVRDVKINDYFQNGDKVVVIGTEQLRSRQNGATNTSDWAAVFTFRKEHIAEVLVIEDLSILSAGQSSDSGQLGCGFDLTQQPVEIGTR